MWVQVPVDVVDDDSLFVCGDVGHDEILLKRSWQHAIATVVNVLADDVYTARCPAVKQRFSTIEFLKAAHNCQVAWFVLLLDGVVNILVQVTELVNNCYGLNLGGRLLLLFYHLIIYLKNF